MLIGYARVSTGGQHLDLQKESLKGIGCQKIYEDQAMGARVDLPGLNPVKGSCGMSIVHGIPWRWASPGFCYFALGKPTQALNLSQPRTSKIHFPVITEKSNFAYFLIFPPSDFWQAR